MKNLEQLLESMNADQFSGFARQSKSLDESEKIKLAKKILGVTRMQLNESVGYQPAMSADDFRTNAAKHDRKADGLVSGDDKDSHTIAAKNCRKAANCIDKANRSAAKAALLD